MAWLVSRGTITDLTPSNLTTGDHTPGPWRAFWHTENERLALGSWRLARNDDHPVPLYRVRRNNPTAEANARLIAAAPDMLAALKEVYRCKCIPSGPHCGNIVTSQMMHDASEQVRTAIAKAEGRA
jgi:hypothetical protein